MKAILVYADGHTETRFDGGAHWWIVPQKGGESRFFFGWEQAYDATDRTGEPFPHHNIIVYVERPKHEFEARRSTSAKP